MEAVTLVERGKPAERSVFARREECLPLDATRFITGLFPSIDAPK
jgi:hypothetical protein